MTRLSPLRTELISLTQPCSVLVVLTERSSSHCRTRVPGRRSCRSTQESSTTRASSESSNTDAPNASRLTDSFEELARSTEDMNAAQLKAVCVEAGMVRFVHEADKIRAYISWR